MAALPCGRAAGSSTASCSTRPWPEHAASALCPTRYHPCRAKGKGRRATLCSVSAAEKERAAVEVSQQADHQPLVRPDADFDPFVRYQRILRAAPLAAGALGIAGVVLNRLYFGIAPVVDASSSQSRTDVIVIGLSAVLVLTGLQWLSLTPIEQEPVDLHGCIVSYASESLTDDIAAELQWAWQALSAATRCCSMVVILGEECVWHSGYAGAGHLAGVAAMGPICRQVLQSQRGNYLANLVLYPGRVEFAAFLPDNTQGVIVQPVGEAGVLIVGTNVLRGFSRLDQAWVAALADKLSASLSP